MRVRLPADLLDRLETEARKAFPNEACALLLGEIKPSGVDILDCKLSRNVTAGDAKTSFEIEPELHLALQKRAREGALDVVGVWHSHPHGAARPSAEDARRSLMPRWCWLITGFGPGRNAESAAFVALDGAPHILEPVPMVLR